MPAGRFRFVDSAGGVRLAAFVKKGNHAAMAAWAADCAKRVLRHFEEAHPGDDRPRKAIAGARRWARTGIFRMAEARGIALAAHAAARTAPADSPARFAARAAGHAMATAHAKTHAIAAAWYAAKAVAAADPQHAPMRVSREREWQYRRLRESGMRR